MEKERRPAGRRSFCAETNIRGSRGDPSDSFLLWAVGSRRSRAFLYQPVFYSVKLTEAGLNLEQPAEKKSAYAQSPKTNRLGASGRENAEIYWYFGNLCYNIIHFIHKGGIAVPSCTITGFNASEGELRQCYQRAKCLNHLADGMDLDLIFEVAMKNRDRFPGINLQGQQTLQLYISRWVKGYCDAVNHPSQRIAKPKSACTDPAIRVIVQATQGITDAIATAGEIYHNLFMSAENIQGNLLEQYIALRVRPYGFLWCEGNVLRAVDFCNTDGSCMLQIKNKSNTENSSSSNIREGTTIEKWFRLGTRTSRGVKYPDYKWDVLNRLINVHKTMGIELPPCKMTEEDYQAFLKCAADANRGMITSL